MHILARWELYIIENNWRFMKQHYIFTASFLPTQKGYKKSKTLPNFIVGISCKVAWAIEIFIGQAANEQPLLSWQR